MRKTVLIAAAAIIPLATGGCVRTAASVVTAPFKAAGKVVDWSTTSQEEADRNYGRKMRKADAREGKERREWQKRCRKDPGTCGPYDGFVAGRDR